MWWTRKLIRSKSKTKSTRPRYIVDEPSSKGKKKPCVSVPSKMAPLDTEEIKHALVETMETLEEKLVQTIKQEFEKVRLEVVLTQEEGEQARRDEQKQFKELFDEHKETLSAVLEQQQEQAKTTSASRIEAAIIKALEMQQNQQQQLVSKDDIQELEIKLTGKIQEMVDGYKKIKIYNDLDMRALSQTVVNQHKQIPQRQQSEIDAELSNKHSSTKRKQTPVNTST